MGKYSFEEVKKDFEERGYEILFDTYNTTSENLPYICPKHRDKGTQYITYGHLREGKGCYYCGREKTGSARRLKITDDELSSLCKKHNFIYVGNRYENKKLYVDFICKKHKELGVQSMEYQNMKRDLKGCKYCAGKQLPEWYVIEKMQEVNPDVELLEPYVNITTRIKCRCKKHGIISNKTPKEILSGRGCVQCGLEKLSACNTLSNEEYIESVKKINPDITVLGNYISGEEDILVKCNKCGHEWSQKARNFSSYYRICPLCGGYSGEILVSNFLNNFKFKYKQQYRFNDCIDKRPLPFDFAILDENDKVLCLIEYDGEGHFSPVTIMKMPYKEADNAFKNTVKHDMIKDLYCEENNIPLIRIPYWEKEDGNLEYYLFDNLVKIGLLQKIN